MITEVLGEAARCHRSCCTYGDAMAEPELSMLWEQADAETVLPERFGFADATSAATRVSDTLAEHWGIRVTACERIVLSDRNLLAWVHTRTGPLVVKACAWQPLFDRLGAIAEIVAQLGALDLPVAAPRRTLGGAARAVTEDASALSVIVLPEITGDFLDAGDPAAVRATGETLRPSPPGPRGTGDPPARVARVRFDFQRKSTTAVRKRYSRAQAGTPGGRPFSTHSWPTSPTWMSPRPSCTETCEERTCSSTANR